MDFWALLAIIGELRAAIAGAQAMTVGQEEKVYVPDAEELNALVVKGPNGTRTRVIGFVIRREQ